MTSRLFVPLDVNYRDDPRILEVSALAELVYLRSLTLAKRLNQDGQIHRAHLYGLCEGFEEDGIANQLVHVGLWEPTEDGWLIRAWLKHNPSADELEQVKQSERDRKAAWRASHRTETSATEVSRGTESLATERPAYEVKKKRSDSEDEKSRKRLVSPTEDFEPTDNHRAFADEHGLDLDRERAHWIVDCDAKARKYVRLNSGFTTWLHHAVNFGRGGQAQTLRIAPALNGELKRCPRCSNTGNVMRGGVLVECDHQEAK